MGVTCIDNELGKKIVDLYIKEKNLRKIERILGGKPSRPTIKKFLIEQDIYEECNIPQYSDEDIKIISELYVEDNWDEIFRLYPNTTKKRITTICNYRGITKLQKWSKEDEKFLIDNYNKLSVNEIVNALDNRHTYKGVTAKAKKLGIQESRLWSDEENDILKKFYSILPKEEISKLLPNKTYHAIVDHARLFDLKSLYYLRQYTEEQDRFIIENWNELTDEEIGVQLGKTRYAITQHRSKLGLFRHNKDYSNYSNLAKFFRGQLTPWKLESMKNCNYSCVFTGSKDFEIHHLVSFNTILMEAIEIIENEFAIFSDILSDYTKEQLDIMKEIFVTVHNKYPLGECVRKDIHKYFHKIYGSGGNTQEQWAIFKNKFLMNEYDFVI